MGPPGCTLTDTLFPYTALFRSGARGDNGCAAMERLLTGLWLNGGCGLLLLRLGGRDRRQLLAAFGRPVELFDLRILAQIGNRLLDDLVRHHEIGRASCRERVCQYV